MTKTKMRVKSELLAKLAESIVTKYYDSEIPKRDPGLFCLSIFLKDLDLKRCPALIAIKREFNDYAQQLTDDYLT